MSGDEDIRGQHITLRAASPEDGRTILDWLYRSDVTPSMLGPPLYPERLGSRRREVMKGATSRTTSTARPPNSAAAT